MSRKVPVSNSSSLCFRVSSSDPALNAALTAPAFYGGALGSKKTQAKRAERRAALGLDKVALEKIHGPVGLDIGAVSPGEIAVAIMAEIINEMRGD